MQMLETALELEHLFMTCEKHGCLVQVQSQLPSYKGSSGSEKAIGHW